MAEHCSILLKADRCMWFHWTRDKVIPQKYNIFKYISNFKVITPLNWKWVFFVYLQKISYQLLRDCQVIGVLYKNMDNQ